MQGPAVEVMVLRDNHAREGLRAGHGLALMIGTAAGSFLLDTGDSAQTWANADAMGVDPAQAQALVLSHGHYDHTRGLPGLLQRLGELRVIAHPLVFEPRYHETPDGEMA
ncbi:MAG: MBL fold metallo-hydrolase, partial [Armatimonadota bacterium]|nr:MBL fold metallo-hydrolase [Armatimonadota bacterium]